MNSFRSGFLLQSKLKVKYVIQKSRCLYSVQDSNNIKPYKLSIGNSILNIYNLKSIVLTVLGLHTSVPLQAKHFQERENEYAHFIMENAQNYSSSVLKHPLSVGKRNLKFDSYGNVFDEFIKISQQNFTATLNLEDSNFSDLIKDISLMLRDATDDTITQVLRSLCLWPPTRKTYTANFKLLWNTLDEECTRRMDKWNVSRKLLIADHWFHLRLSRITSYNAKLIFDLLGIVEFLKNHEVIQLMFLINLQRKVPQEMLSRLEKKLESVVNEVSLEELGIVCLGFFKTENKIANINVIKSIIQRFLIDMNNVNTITIAALLKFLRKSLHSSITNIYISLMHKCVPCVPRWDIPTSVHLALLSSECNVYHPLLLNVVSNKLSTEMESARLKDCTKLLQCLSHFNHYQEIDFHVRYNEELQKESRQDEIILYPRDIVYSVLFYAYMGQFNYELIAKCLDKHFMEQSCIKYPNLVFAFAEIDYCIEIECQDYSGPRVEKNMLTVLEKRRGNMPYVSKASNMQTRLIKDINEYLIDILGGRNNILVWHILPHLFSPDIIVRLSKSGENSLTDLYKDFPSDSVLIPPADEVWACFVICGTFSFAYQSKHLTGVTAMKLRQLEKIGYKTIFIPYFDLPSNLDQQKKLCEKKIKFIRKTLLSKRSY